MASFLLFLLHLLVHLQHPLRQEGQEIVHHIRTLLLGDKVASRVLGQAGVHLGQDLGVLAIGISCFSSAPRRAPSGAGVAAEMRRNIENRQCSKPL
jgi:hypothetical protein